MDADVPLSHTAALERARCAKLARAEAARYRKLVASYVNKVSKGEAQRAAAALDALAVMIERGE